MFVPRYQRRLRGRGRHLPDGEQSAAHPGALQPLLKAAPLSKSAISCIFVALKAEQEAWLTRLQADLEVVYFYWTPLPCGCGARAR
jgi:hypothetical protein